MLLKNKYHISLEACMSVCYGNSVTMELLLLYRRLFWPNEIPQGCLCWIQLYLIPKEACSSSVTLINLCSELLQNGILLLLGCIYQNVWHMVNENQVQHFMYLYLTWTILDKKKEEENKQSIRNNSFINFVLNWELT